MKAPDKIYITQYHENFIGDRWNNEPFPSEHATNHEYIHKDVLLEYAKEQIQIMRNGKESAITINAKLDVIENLLDKIESL